ncbi:MAG: NUDIX hydrolase [Proteobacteria bacterium]|nr:NUDIX hydrolase [Pseudomonadota bacterium]MBU1611110.1 NUDIX hydrolase [Pseudomonadota bacterium]
MNTVRPCPHCGKDIEVYRNPKPTVDVVIHHPLQGVVLIERSNEPLGWALPGGFVDYGESCETAAVREAREETGLQVELTGLLGVYSDPDRDPRHHTLSVVYTGRTEHPDALTAGDDAANAQFFPLGEWPKLAFDHERILADFLGGLSQMTDRMEG